MGDCQVVVATRNAHKLREIREMLAIDGIEFIGASEWPGLPEVEEDGDTFADNAAKKAVAIARASGRWALADDSGLVVDALGGAPGVHSARYAGEAASDEENNDKLLRELAGCPRRAARFRCALALADPGGECRVVEGACEGTIAMSTSGDNGFGYDVLFVPQGCDLTFGVLDAATKNRMSHRAKALATAQVEWRDLFAALAARG